MTGKTGRLNGSGGGTALNSVPDDIGTCGCSTLAGGAGRLSTGRGAAYGTGGGTVADGSGICWFSGSSSFLVGETGTHSLSERKFLSRKESRKFHPNTVNRVPVRLCEEPLDTGNCNLSCFDCSAAFSCRDFTGKGMEF